MQPETSNQSNQNQQSPQSVQNVVNTPNPAVNNQPSDELLRVLLPVGRSGWAIAAGYVALFSVLLFPAPLALILGIVALRHINNHPGKIGKGRAWFAIIMGSIFTLLLLLIALFN